MQFRGQICPCTQQNPTPSPIPPHHKYTWHRCTWCRRWWPERNWQRSCPSVAASRFLPAHRKQELKVHLYEMNTSWIQCEWDLPVWLVALPVRIQLRPLTAWPRSCSLWSSRCRSRPRWPSPGSPADRTERTGGGRYGLTWELQIPSLHDENRGATVIKEYFRLEVLFSVESTFTHSLQSWCW